MRFNVDRMGEQYQDVSLSWLASITTEPELDRVAELEIGERIRFKRAFTGPVGYTRSLEVIRIK